jgi:hypothetical protein
MSGIALTRTNKVMALTCLVCGRELENKRTGAKFCSDAHRKQYERAAEEKTGEELLTRLIVVLDPEHKFANRYGVVVGYREDVYIVRFPEPGGKFVVNEMFGSGKATYMEVELERNQFKVEPRNVAMVPRKDVQA